METSDSDGAPYGEGSTDGAMVVAPDVWIVEVVQRGGTSPSGDQIASLRRLLWPHAQAVAEGSGRLRELRVSVKVRRSAAGTAAVEGIGLVRQASSSAGLDNWSVVGVSARSLDS